MKTIIISFVLLFASLPAFSQDIDSLAISQLRQTVEQLKTDLKNQKTDFSAQQSEMKNTVDSLKLEIAKERENLDILANSLGTKIVDTQTKAEQQIQTVRQTVSENTLYWIIAVLAIALLSFVLFWFLRRKQNSDKTDLIAQLSEAKSSIEESLVKEFGKQTELMDAQMELLEKQKTDTKVADAEPDHSLALKLASEINIIERNISLMDAGTKGLKQLLRSVEKLKDNLAANGYETPQLLGKPFNQGMKVIVVNSVPDENLEKGVEIISKVLIPQVIYNGTMIQTAQIEVSVGY